MPLKQTDPSHKLKKDKYKQQLDELTIDLGEAQRKCKDLGIPVIILFEGWSASGKGSRIRTLIRSLDPRGFEVFTVHRPNEDELMRPYMWRFWKRTPPKGKIHVFDRSWYRALMRGHEKNEIKLAKPVHDVLSFEKTLVASGVVIVKMFLHVSMKEQRKRLKALADSPETSWRINEDDWIQNCRYDETLSRYSKMIEDTDHDMANWSVIEADNGRHADVKVYKTVLAAMESAISKKESGNSVDNGEIKMPIGVNSASALTAVNLHRTLERDEYTDRLSAAQNELTRLHNEMYLHRVPMAIVFEGWDAAGKGGAIKRLVAPFDPRGYKVAPYGAPNDIEKAHNYLWRFWNEVPKAGHLTVFDRSWYGRVMVERVEGFCSEDDWKRAFKEINDFEKQLVDSGMILLKFWLHIDKEEQLRRFNFRKETPEKQWKITDEDWRNRDKWDAYLEAVDEMLLRTSTKYAPWTIVEAVDKPYARIKVIEAVHDCLENGLKAVRK
ncbi:MAG: polyphosphate:AMP phosphotransferase [Oscillospiraceae bacterium]|nr:polyphosphate:AMP phosphotransferase [Oscillospiraceae bacterium]